MNCIQGAFSGGGGGGGAVWEELANVSSTAASQSSGTIEAKKYLDITIYGYNRTGTGDADITLNFNGEENGDSNTNSTTEERSSNENFTGRTSTDTWLLITGYTDPKNVYSRISIVNFDGEYKIGICNSQVNYENVTTAPFAQFTWGVWNQSAQITSILAAIDSSYGTFDWNMVVLGHD